MWRARARREGGERGELSGVLAADAARPPLVGHSPPTHPEREQPTTQQAKQACGLASCAGGRIRRWPGRRAQESLSFTHLAVRAEEEEQLRMPARCMRRRAAPRIGWWRPWEREQAGACVLCVLRGVAWQTGMERASRGLGG